MINNASSAKAGEGLPAPNSFGSVSFVCFPCYCVQSWHGLCLQASVKEIEIAPENSIKRIGSVQEIHKALNIQLIDLELAAVAPSQLYFGEKGSAQV